MKKLLLIICFMFVFGIMLPMSGCTIEEQPEIYTVNFIVDGEIWKTLTSDKINDVEKPTKQYCDFAYWDFDETINDGICNAYAKFTLTKRYECVKVSSGSMTPVLKPGDYIIVDTEAVEFKVGDIVVFRTAGGVSIIQRLIEINGDECILKGDANSKDSGPVSIDQIVGLVCENIGQTLPDAVVSQ